MFISLPSFFHLDSIVLLAHCVFLFVLVFLICSMILILVLFLPALL